MMPKIIPVVPTDEQATIARLREANERLRGQYNEKCAQLAESHRQLAESEMLLRQTKQSAMSASETVVQALIRVEQMTPVCKAALDWETNVCTGSHKLKAATIVYRKIVASRS